MFSCSKSEQKQLNTWVSFQSAEQPLLGQFSVSGNNLPADRAIDSGISISRPPSPNVELSVALPIKRPA
ncbi:hypothetical protein DND58_24845 [Pseudomonas syringae pv. pisi]|nr:hypothetical protein DND58_24845 [Pseudomonas syringae pv. pisi]